MRKAESASQAESASADAKAATADFEGAAPVAESSAAKAVPHEGMKSTLVTKMVPQSQSTVPHARAIRQPAPLAPADKGESEYHGLSREQMLSIYRTMYLSRKIDDKEINSRSEQSFSD